MTDLLTTADVARMAGISVTTVTREVARDNLRPALRGPGPAGALFFRSRDVDRWIKARARKQAS